MFRETAKTKVTIFSSVFTVLQSKESYPPIMDTLAGHLARLAAIKQQFNLVEATQLLPQEQKDDDQRGERAIKIQHKLMEPFEHCDDDVVSKMNAASIIVSWLIDLLESACTNQKIPHFVEHLQIIHPFLIMQITSFGGSTAMSLNECLRVSEMLTAYEEYLKVAISIFPQYLTQERYSIDEKNFLVKVCKKNISLRLAEMVHNIKIKILDDVNPMSHVKKIGSGLIATNVANDLAGISCQFASSANQSSSILSATVLQCIAADLLAGYTLHIRDYIQRVNKSPIPPAFLVASANDCLKLATSIETSLLDQYSDILEKHEAIEEAIQESQNQCIFVANLCISTLSDFIGDDLMTIETTLFDNKKWIVGEEMDSVVLTNADYCREFCSENSLDKSLIRVLIRSFYQRTIVFYCRSLLTAGLKLNEKSRLSIGTDNEKYLLRDAAALQTLAKELCVELLGTENLPKSIVVVGQLLNWFVKILTTPQIVNLTKSVFQEIITKLLRSHGEQNTSIRLLSLSQAYCFVSQSLLLRSSLKNELNEQIQELSWCRNELESYGVTVDTLKKIETKEYAKGWMYQLSGLSGMLQRICPLCTDQWVRDIKAIKQPKKRMPTKLSKKYGGYRPKVEFVSGLNLFNKNSVIPTLGKVFIVRVRDTRNEKEEVKNEDPFKLVSENESLESVVERESSLDVDALTHDLLGDMDDIKLKNERSSSPFDLGNLEEDLLGDFNPVLVSTNALEKPPQRKAPKVPSHLK